MSAISVVVGSTLLFDRELWVGGVAGVGGVDIDGASNGKFGGVVSLSRTEIVLEMACLGYKCFHVASEENEVK